MDHLIRISLATCILSSASFLNGVSTNVKQFSVEHVISNDDVLLTPTHLAREDKGVLYGTLDKTTSNNEIILDLYLETPTFKKHVPILLGPGRRLARWDEYQFYSFGQHAALVVVPSIYMGASRHIKAIIIADMMSNKTYNVDIPTDLHEHQIVSFIFYPDKFDLVTSHLSLCDYTFNECRVTFDSTGNKVGQPEDFRLIGGTRGKTIIPASGNSSNGEFFVESFDESLIRLQVQNLDHNGQVKSLVKGIPWYYDATSNMYNRSTICGLASNERSHYLGDETEYGNRYTKCLHHDWNTGKTINISIQEGKNTRGMTVTNLAQGGFVVSIRSCRAFSECNSFNVTIIEPNRELTHRGPFPLNLECGDSSWDFWNKQEIGLIEIGEEICAAFSCQNFKDNQHNFQYYIRCFDKKFFTAGEPTV